MNKKILFIIQKFCLFVIFLLFLHMVFTAKIYAKTCPDIELNPNPATTCPDIELNPNPGGTGCYTTVIPTEGVPVGTEITYCAEKEGFWANGLDVYLCKVSPWGGCPYSITGYSNEVCVTATLNSPGTYQGVFHLKYPASRGVCSVYSTGASSTTCELPDCTTAKSDTGESGYDCNSVINHDEIVFSPCYSAIPHRSKSGEQKIFTVYKPPTPTPISVWFKLKNSSFHKYGTLNNPIPNTPQSFDSGDSTDPYLVVGGAGLVSAENLISLDPGSASQSNMRIPNYTYTSPDSLTSFIEYTKLRKKFKIINNLNEIESNTINIYQGNITITSPSDITSNLTNFVLLVNGNIQFGDIPGNKFNNAGRSIAMMATGTLRVHSSVKELNGVFITQAVDLAYDKVSPDKGVNELKINGNLISSTNISSLKRERADSIKPTFFIVLNPTMYVDLLPHLSTIIQEGRQIQ